jgi:hypothetical protein
MAGVRKVSGWPSFASAAGVTLRGSLRCLGDVIQIKVAAIVVRQYQRDYYSHRGLRACRSIRGVCIAWSSDHNLALLYTVCLGYTLTTRFLVVTNSSSEKYVTLFEVNMYIEN